MKTYTTLILLLTTAGLIGCSSTATKPESSGNDTATLKTESQAARAKMGKYFGKTTSQKKKLVKQSNRSYTYSKYKSYDEPTDLDFLSAKTDEQCNTLFSPLATLELEQEEKLSIQPAGAEKLIVVKGATRSVMSNRLKANTVKASRHAPPSSLGKFDLWCRIRNGYQLEVVENDYVQRAIERYVRYPGYFEEMADKARPYLYHIVAKVEQRKMPLEIALLPAIESAFEPLAISPKSAAGIWQFIPGTGRDYGLIQTEWYDGRRDFMAATDAALDYLERLSETFDGDWLVALAAYNYGEGNIRKAIRKNEAQGKPTDFWSLDLPSETRWYVPKLLALAKIVSNPKDYGLRLKSIPDSPYLQQVQVRGQISLSLAANLAGLSTTDFIRLNAGYRLGMTGPEGTQNLTVPIHNAHILKQRLAKMPLPTPTWPYSGLEEISQWKNDNSLMSSGINTPGLSIVFSDLPAEPVKAPTQVHRVNKGDTLERIAQLYDTSIAKLHELNPSLRGDLVKAGSLLTVPVSEQNVSVTTQKSGMTGTKKSVKEPLSAITPVRAEAFAQRD